MRLFEWFSNILFNLIIVIFLIQKSGFLSHAVLHSCTCSPKLARILDFPPPRPHLLWSLTRNTFKNERSCCFWEVLKQKYKSAAVHDSKICSLVSIFTPPGEFHSHASKTVDFTKVDFEFSGLDNSNSIISARVDQCDFN